MIDKNGIISENKTLFEKISSAIKGNTPQLAILIPILTAVQVAALNYYFYLENCGYYNYFGIDKRLMLPNDKINLYQNITIIAFLVAYWIYAIFAVRMFLLKQNYIGKIVCLILLPFISGVVLAKGYSEIFSIAVIVGVCILFHWVMIFILGFWYVRSFHEDIMESSKKDKARKKNKKFKARWGNKEYGMLGILFIALACIIMFAQGYFDSHIKAEKQRKFGIIDIDDVHYAVIDANTNKLVLQRCRMDSNILYIEKDTYYCIENSVLIQYETFNNVFLE